MFTNEETKRLIEAVEKIARSQQRQAEAAERMAANFEPYLEASKKANEAAARLHQETAKLKKLQFDALKFMGEFAP